MAKAPRREWWDICSVLRHTMMQCGFSKFDRIPSPTEMNPFREDEWGGTEESSFEQMDELIASTLAQG